MKETEDIIGGLLSAGIDTTAGMLSWKLLHLASSPEAQDKIHQELQPTLSHGKLTRESLVLPYLNACIRESHRLRNPIVTIPMKVLPEERSVHGQRLPKDSVIIFDGYSTGMQHEHFVEPVNEFHPERFSPEAVQERKGTDSQIVDHTLFKNPFSDGARKCPGSRVASLEAVAFCAQLVLDYKMELPSGIQHWSDVSYGLETVTTAYLPKIQFSPRH
jgi:cytochrome P450